ncbi:MAG TPA: hypothetical protein VFS10_07745 [Pyrinomonadaceae bacterium]|nr:hypothetical protein [Pyrinomonadaceae bacterium]
MNRTRHALTLALALFVTGCAASLLPSARADASKAQQTDAPRRPAGPATGPVIKLPRGQGEGLEQPHAGEGARGSAARRWEYCAITHTFRRQSGFGSSSSTFATVRYYPNGNEEIEGKDEEDAIANALVKLGEEGWELVAVRQNLNLLDGSGKATHTYLFKRQK